MNVIKKVWFVLLGGGLMFQIFAPVALAADAGKPLNLITSPLPINLSTDPGHVITTDLRVKQGGSDTEQLKVSLMKFAAYGDEGKPQLLDRGPGDDYFDWVKFDKTTFSAPSNVWETVHMTINVPKTAAFGYYYAVVFSRAGDDAAPTEAKTNAINGGTAVLVLLDATVPNAKRQLQLTSFSSDHRIYEFLPATFSIKFRNTGNVHLVPNGNIFITQGKKQVAALQVNEQVGNVLPGSNRIYTETWDNGFPHYETTVVNGNLKADKKGNPIMHLVWSNPTANAKEALHLRFGHYTAHLFAVYDDGQRDVPMEASVSFWVIPWRFLLVVLVILALILLAVFFILRRVWKGVRRLRRGKR